MKQTIANSFKLQGIGLHTGHEIRMKVSQASRNHGIVFNRVDVAADIAKNGGNPKKSLIKAKFDNVSQTMLSTTLENSYGVRIGTVEHLMAGLWGMGIDNALIEINGSEVPIMDGSSKVFIEEIKKCGVKKQDVPRKLLVINEEIRVIDQDSYALVKPSKKEAMTIDVEIDFADDFIGNQSASFDSSKDKFDDMLYLARTFGLKKNIDELISNNLVLGGSLDNALVVDGSKLLNKEGLRFPNEFAMHKLLDCIGDYYLAGIRIIGEFKSFKPSHKLNNMLIREIFTNPDSFEIRYDSENKVEESTVKSVDNQTSIHP